MAMMQFKNIDAGKRGAVIALMTGAVLITVLGVAFGIYTFINHITYQALGTEIPGFIFGAVVAFLGVRYFISTIKLAKKLAGNHEPFKWENFKIRKLSLLGRNQLWEKR